MGCVVGQTHAVLAGAAAGLNRGFAAPMLAGQDQLAATCLQKALIHFAACVAALGREPLWSKHAQAIQAESALAHSIAQVLLTRCLPAAAAEAQRVLHCQDYMPLASLQARVSQLTWGFQIVAVSHAAMLHLQQQGATAAAATAAAGILLALPSDISAVDQPKALVTTWSSSLRVLGWILHLAGFQPAAGSRAPGSPAVGRERQLAAVAFLSAFPAAAAVVRGAAGCIQLPDEVAAQEGDEEEATWRSTTAGLCSNLNMRIEGCGQVGQPSGSRRARHCLQVAGGRGSRHSVAACADAAEPDWAAAARPRAAGSC